MTPAAVSLAAAGRRTAHVVGRLLLDAAVALALSLLVFLAVGPRVLPYQTVTMLTGSMRPAVPPGSLAVETSEPVGSLRAGQVISFHAPVPGHPVVTHRVIDVSSRGGRVLVRTRGDANSGADPWTAVVRGNRVWRVRAVIPDLGSAVRLLRRADLHLLVAWVLPGVLLAWVVVGIWRPSTDSAGARGGVRRCAASEPPASPSVWPRACALQPGNVRSGSRHRARRALSR